MNRYLMYISYIGTRFRGIQKQVNKLEENFVDRSTVQGCIEIALQRLNPANEINLQISSRTDAGVHALCSSVHVDLQRNNGQLLETESVTGVLNKYFYSHYLPIRIIKTLHVPDSFHCRFSAKGRTYLYRLAVAKNTEPDLKSLRNLNFNKFIPVEEFERCYFIQHDTFSIDAVKEAAKLIEGKHDFRSFIGVNQQGKKEAQEIGYRSAVRVINEISIKPGNPVASYPDFEKAKELYNYWDITISAKSFLYKQVRRIVAVLVAAGIGRLTTKDVYEMLTIPSKFSWPPQAVVAPACGLYLCNVHYNEEDLKFADNSVTPSDSLQTLDFSNKTEMSLQEALQRKKNQLKATKTIVTHADGSKVIENGNDIKKLEEKSCGFVIDTKPDVTPACILENALYLGSQDSVDVNNIDKYNITHILSVGIETPSIDRTDLVCKFIPCLDLPETNLVGVSSEANAFIAEAIQNNKIVLVHCNAGVSRSAAIVISFLMNHQNLSFNDAYCLVKSKRECIQPNTGFMQQLKMFQNNVKCDSIN